MNRKSLIVSIKSFKLSSQERSLFFSQKPWGIILFKRNIKNTKQLKQLTTDIRKLMRDPSYPILVDEEGGKVSRLTNIIDTKIFSQNLFGSLFEKDNFLGKNYYTYYLGQISALLKAVGININTIPVLDLQKRKTNKIIGNRSYSNNIKTIRFLGDLCISILKKNKIGSVAKHIPGHGCSTKDTHKELAVVKESFSYLLNNDFKIFKNINSQFAMTAHIIYDKIDQNFTASHSDILIKNIIRKKLKYKGLIMSDDISMKALSENLLYNAIKSIQAGCNIALYCGGDVKISALLLKNMKNIDDFTIKKTSEFYNFLR